jgi:hypothetical protein
MPYKLKRESDIFNLLRENAELKIRLGVAYERNSEISRELLRMRKILHWKQVKQEKRAGSSNVLRR